MATIIFSSAEQNGQKCVPSKDMKQLEEEVVRLRKYTNVLSLATYIRTKQYALATSRNHGNSKGQEEAHTRQGAQDNKKEELLYRLRTSTTASSSSINSTAPTSGAAGGKEATDAHVARMVAMCYEFGPAVLLRELLHDAANASYLQHKQERAAAAAPRQQKDAEERGNDYPSAFASAGPPAVFYTHYQDPLNNERMAVREYLCDVHGAAEQYAAAYVALHYPSSKVVAAPQQKQPSKNKSGKQVPAKPSEAEHIQRSIIRLFGCAHRKERHCPHSIVPLSLSATSVTSVPPTAWSSKKAKGKQTNKLTSGDGPLDPVSNSTATSRRHADAAHTSGVASPPPPFVTTAVPSAAASPSHDALSSRPEESESEQQAATNASQLYTSLDGMNGLLADDAAGGRSRRRRRHEHRSHGSAQRAHGQEEESVLSFSTAETSHVDPTRCAPAAWAQPHRTQGSTNDGTSTAEADEDMLVRVRIHHGGQKGRDSGSSSNDEDDHDDDDDPVGASSASSYSSYFSSSSSSVSAYTDSSRGNIAPSRPAAAAAGVAAAATPKANRVSLVNQYYVSQTNRGMVCPSSFIDMARYNNDNTIRKYYYQYYLKQGVDGGKRKDDAGATATTEEAADGKHTTKRQRLMDYIIHQQTQVANVDAQDVLLRTSRQIINSLIYKSTPGDGAGGAATPGTNNRAYVLPTEKLNHYLATVPTYAQAFVLNDLACEAHKDGYIDPMTGNFFFSSRFLEQFEDCDGLFCKHCPHNQNEKQRQAKVERSSGARAPMTCFELYKQAILPPGDATAEAPQKRNAGVIEGLDDVKRKYFDRKSQRHHDDMEDDAGEASVSSSRSGETSSHTGDEDGSVAAASSQGRRGRSQHKEEAPQDAEGADVPPKKAVQKMSTGNIYFHIQHRDAPEGVDNAHESHSSQVCTNAFAGAIVSAHTLDDIIRWKIKPPPPTATATTREEAAGAAAPGAMSPAQQRQLNRRVRRQKRKDKALLSDKRTTTAATSTTNTFMSDLSRSSSASSHLLHLEEEEEEDMPQELHVIDFEKYDYLDFAGL